MSPRRIAILCAGSRGDVFPYAALGHALQSRGSVVRLVTFTPFREVAARQGLEFRAVSDPMAAVKESENWHRWQSPNSTLPRKLWSLCRLLELCREPFTRMLDECFEACRDCDAVISASSGFAGPHIAEKMGVPFSWAYLQPETPTGDFPHYMSPWRRSLGQALNYATYSVAALCWQALFGSTLAQWRSRALRLPSLNYRLVAGDNSPAVLYGFSRHVIAKPSDWDERKHVTGYWFLQSDLPWQPSAELSKFLTDGPPPIAICLDSIKGSLDFVNVVTCATRETKQRAIVVRGSAALPIETGSKHVITISSAPYLALFRSVTAVIHHGGAGTSAASLHARRPSILVPSFFDQPFWAARMYRLGVCPAPLSPHRLSVRVLADAIREVTSRPQYRERASELGQKITEEDGVASAARILMEYLR